MFYDLLLPSCVQMHQVFTRCLTLQQVMARTYSAAGWSAGWFVSQYSMTTCNSISGADITKEVSESLSPTRMPQERYGKPCVASSICPLRRLYEHQRSNQFEAGTRQEWRAPVPVEHEPQLPMFQMLHRLPCDQRIDQLGQLKIINCWTYPP